MAALVRSFNWASTSLGAMEQWPKSLVTAVGICLNSPLPMFVWWGPDLINIHNDAYIPVLGNKHSAALGQRPGKSGPIVAFIGEEVDGVMQRGISVRAIARGWCWSEMGIRKKLFHLFAQPDSRR